MQPVIQVPSIAGMKGEKEYMQADVYDLFIRFQIPLWKKGSNRLEKILEYLRGKDLSGMRVTEDVYKVVAKQCKCTWEALERSIRELIKKCWDNQETKALLEKEFFYSKRPTVSEFITNLSAELEYKKKRGRRGGMGTGHAPPTH